MHTAQMEKFAAAEAEAAERPQANGSSGEEQSSGGSLASDAQLAALREKLAGSA
jgi:small subunit ribosomal protein S1